jgi:hypothetical protein
MVHLIRVKASMSVNEHLSRTRGKRKILAHEKAVAYDVAQLLSFERGFAQHQLETRGTGDGRPSFAVLVACWKRARESFERVTKALPLDSLLREEMTLELAARDKAMDDIARKAEALLDRGKEANSHVQ